jgi:hypothetical protein
MIPTGGNHREDDASCWFLRFGHDKPVSSTASVAANKDETFLLACVCLTPIIGGK